MKILVIGSGGREHALVWKLHQSAKVTRLYCAPGNAGTAALATNLPIAIDDHDALVAFAKKEGIALTVVGPDDALAAGVVDRFAAEGLRAFGPTQAGARLESSKVYAKEFMRRYGIPCAASGHFSDPGEALRFCETMRYPVVVKADGLALGKGVIIAQTPAEAAKAIEEIMVRRLFGDAGRQVVIEEFLTGEESSVHAVIGGGKALLFPSAQDHKAIYDGDKGPNTGGMGTFSPAAKLVTPELEATIRTEVLDRFLAGLRGEGLPFTGLLFPGLMITADGLRVLEFNCRFGDPETQVLLPRLKSDLVDLLEAALDGRLDEVTPEWDERAAVCVIMASGGYPGSYAKGKAITGLEKAEALGDVHLFHAGTRCGPQGLETAGGRVLGVTALGGTLEAARARAYEAVAQIHFEGATFRRDIGAKGL
ncbi:MAG TPA: phosphoribosylamine--glycine ligase [Chthoniobacteraceae bacterium]|nr:phosphoribosylamine--glycine ligase [Chthoniobacteraceae bacterium]